MSARSSGEIEPVYMFMLNWRQGAGSSLTVVGQPHGLETQLAALEIEFILLLEMSTFVLKAFLMLHEAHVHCYCSVAKSCLTLCDPMDCSTPGFPVLHYLPEFAQTHGHWVGDAIQPSHSLSHRLTSAFNLSQKQSLCQWISSMHQVANVLEFQLQHHFFQWIFRDNFL